MSALSHQSVSSDYKILNSRSELSPTLYQGWQAPPLAERQMAAYIPLLEAMYEGKPRLDFIVAAQALKLTLLSNPTLLEIGCGNGYYFEVLTHLTRTALRYMGVDYSSAMVESAHIRYPQLRFLLGDATQLPFVDGQFDVAWSGTVLMHIPDYQQAIAETCRVARRFCVFHSSPLLIDGTSTFLRKRAYGTPIAEVIIGQAEFEDLLHEPGLVIRHILESLPYRVDSVVNGTVHTLTYVCEKHCVK